MTPKTLPELRSRRIELMRDLWDYVKMPRPSGDGANDAFDGEIAAMERDLADVERQIVEFHAGTLRRGP